MPILHVVLCSTRPNRIGEPIAKWFMALAETDRRFTPELIDLKTIDLPPMDEPEHPRLKNYQHAHTKAWSETVSRADAYVFVTPEYNFSGPPALYNALNYVFQEWAYKPAGFVSYGGVSGGLRSVQHIKSALCALRVMPIPEAVTLPFAAKQIENGAFTPPELQVKAAGTMLGELMKWHGALQTLRG
jgi:NAD(P)H-dependent FMN reductase